MKVLYQTPIYVKRSGNFRNIPEYVVVRCDKYFSNGEVMYEGELPGGLLILFELDM